MIARRLTIAHIRAIIYLARRFWSKDRYIYQEVENRKERREDEVLRVQRSLSRCGTQEKKSVQSQLTEKKIKRRLPCMSDGNGGGMGFWGVVGAIIVAVLILAFL